MTKLKALPARLARLPSRLQHFESGHKGRSQASPWRAWYNSTRWRRLRRAILLRDMYTCQWPGCGRIEADTSLLVADHKQPHHGNAGMFWDERNLETLCKPCHDGPKQKAELTGRL
jgi:5-methylcytosine-specific restriction protein A